MPTTTDEKTIYEMVPPYVKTAFDSVPEYLRYLDESKLRKEVRPNSAVCALRNSFWMEYQKVFDKGGQFLVSNVIAGICTIEYFSKFVLTNPILVSWIMRPPIHYTKAMEEILSYGLERLRQIMELPFEESYIDKNGFEKKKIDSRTAELVLKAIAFVNLQARGSVVQKHELKTLSLNANVSEGKLMGIAASLSMKDIDEKLEQLRKKEQQFEQSRTIEVPSQEE